MLQMNIFQMLEIPYLNISYKSRSYKDYLKNPLSQSIYLTPTDEKEIWTEIN